MRTILYCELGTGYGGSTISLGQSLVLLDYTQFRPVVVLGAIARDWRVGFRFAPEGSSVVWRLLLGIKPYAALTAGLVRAVGNGSIGAGKAQPVFTSKHA